MRHPPPPGAGPVKPPIDAAASRNAVNRGHRCHAVGDGLVDPHAGADPMIGQSGQEPQPIGAVTARASATAAARRH